MLERFTDVWSTFGDIISALPDDVVTVVAFVFCGVGIIGVLRSF